MITDIKFDIFLSHSSDDKLAVELLARRLVEEANLRPFLDKWHLVPGDRWQAELEKSLEQSACAAVLFGPGSEGPWRNEEMQFALNKAVRTQDDYRVIPVLLPGADEQAVSGFLQLRTWVDFRTGLDDQEAFERLVAGIKGEPVEAGTYSLPDELAPYRGLLRFEKEHSNLFFGRDDEIQRLLDKVARLSFVAIVGASGSGKSSIARAGLLAKLEQNALPGSADWAKLTVLPGADPLRSLADKLSTLAPFEERQRIADDLVNRFESGKDGLRTGTSNLLAEFDRTLFLLVDQFEELFTQNNLRSDQENNASLHFIENLCDAAMRGHSNMRILITLRADFLHHCLRYPNLSKLLEDGQILIGDLNEESLREAILVPAHRVGALLEKGLVDLIMRDVAGQAASLPLLQHALRELWLARRGPWLTMNGYERSGGVAKALHQRAEQTYEQLSEQQKSLTKNIFLRLTAFGEGIVETRRRALRSELYPAGADRREVDVVIEALSGSGSRLIVARENTVEVAHEALIAGWGRLRVWLTKNREALRVHRRLTTESLEWQRRNRPRNLLYDAIRLSEVKQLWMAIRDNLTPYEKDYIRTSWDKHMQSGRRQVFWGLILLAFGLSINALLAGMMYSQAAGEVAMLLVPVPLGFGIGGLLTQKSTNHPLKEYMGALFGALTIAGALLAFFLLIWPSL